MKYGDVTLGQVEAVWNKLGGRDGVQSLLAGKTRVVPVGKTEKKPAVKSGILLRDGSFSACDLATPFDPIKYFQSRGNLYVWPDFVSRIVVVAGPTEAGRKFNKASGWELNENASGYDLLKKRPRDIWSATDFCAWLSVRLTNQPNGEEGELLNTGWANLFLVEGINNEVFVVSVYWDSVHRKWRVDAWVLGREGAAGCRFVSKPIGL